MSAASAPNDLQRPAAEAWSISTIVDHALAGRLRVPAFQRPFRWEARDIERLFDSVWQGYPVGSLLLWSRTAPEAHVEFGPVAVDAPALDRAWWVVDGQQRLTSLVGVLAAPPGTRGAFDLYFDLRDEEFRRPGMRRAPNHWLPMRVVTDTNALLTWLLEFRESGGDERLVERATALGRAIREYSIPVSIVQTPDETALRDIFDRLNTFGRRLTRAEVFQALHMSIEDQQPSDLRALSDEVASLGFGEIREDTVLRSILAVRGGDVFRDFHHEFDADEDRSLTYKAAATALRATVGFLQDEAAIPHVRFLPYAVVVPVLAKFFHLHPEPAPRNLVLLRRWLWRGAISGMGGGTGATAVLRRAMQAVDADQDSSVDRLLSNVDINQLPRLDLGAVQLNRAAARINFALLANLGPREFGTGEAVDLSLMLSDQSEVSMLRVLGAKRPVNLANYFIHPDVSDDEFAELVTGASAVVLESQGIPAEAATSLANEDLDEFLGARRTHLETLLSSRRDALAEPRANDRPPIASLIVPDDERE